LLLRELGGEARVRQRDSRSFVSDNGNSILDWNHGMIDDPAKLEKQLKSLTGVVDSGIFANLAHCVVVAGNQGIRKLQRTRYLFQEMRPSLQRSSDVLDSYAFGGMMTDPSGAADKQHRHGHARSHNHGIMSGATHHPMHRKAAQLDGSCYRVRQRRVAPDPLLIQTCAPIELQLAPLGDRPRATDQPVDRSYALNVVGVPDIQRGAYFAWNHVHRARNGGDRSDSCDESGYRRRFALDFQDPL